MYNPHINNSTFLPIIQIYINLFKNFINHLSCVHIEVLDELAVEVAGGGNFEVSKNENKIFIEGFNVLADRGLIKLDKSTKGKLKITNISL